MNKNIKYLTVLILAIIASLMILSIGILSGINKKTINSTTQDSYSPNATVGALPGKTNDQIKADMQGKIDDGMIAFSINTNMVFTDGNAEGLLKLEAPVSNTNNIQFVINRDDNGEVLYRSGLLKPNSYIDQDKLQTEQPLKKGVYNCTATVTLHDPETEMEKGKVQAAIVIRVEN